jgi:hypothetical protein
MIGSKTVEVNKVVYVYEVTYDYGDENTKTYKVGAFSKSGNRLNFIVESESFYGVKQNVGTIVIPLPNTDHEKQALVDALSKIILSGEGV